MTDAEPTVRAVSAALRKAGHERAGEPPDGPRTPGFRAWTAAGEVRVTHCPAPAAGPAAALEERVKELAGVRRVLAVYAEVLAAAGWRGAPGHELCGDGPVLWFVSALPSLTVLRERAEHGETVSAADAVRLCRALEAVQRLAGHAAEGTALSCPPLRANGAHVREHPRWWECDCPGAIPVMWPLDPGQVREAVAREMSGSVTTAAREEQG